MKLLMFGKLAILAICITLLAFAFVPLTVVDALRMLAVGTVLAIIITTAYPELRGVRQGDVVSVVADNTVPSLIGRFGTAAMPGRKNDRIKIMFQNGSEVTGVVESYAGLISPPKIRAIYEERPIEDR